MKKHIFTILLLMSSDFIKTNFQETRVVDIVDNNEIFFEESATDDFQVSEIVIKKESKKISFRDIPTYFSLIFIGLYESKIKPTYRAVVAYLRLLSLKIRK